MGSYRTRLGSSIIEKSGFNNNKLTSHQTAIVLGYMGLIQQRIDN